MLNTVKKYLLCLLVVPSKSTCYVFHSTVKEYLLSLSSWALSYIEKTSETSTTADVDHHGPFYTVCQALFYVFAFRHKQLFETDDGKRQ